MIMLEVLRELKQSKATFGKRATLGSLYRLLSGALHSVRA